MRAHVVLSTRIDTMIAMCNRHVWRPRKWAEINQVKCLQTFATQKPKSDKIRWPRVKHFVGILVQIIESSASKFLQSKN